MKYQYRATITRVIDGDTYECTLDLGFGFKIEKARIRLYGVNAYEMRGKDRTKGWLASIAAKEWLEASDNLVTVTSHKSGRKMLDSFGRYLFEVINNNGESLGDYLLREGHGVEFMKDK
jgi:micrococcal nuclease